jgi:hypothetical protein
MELAADFGWKMHISATPSSALAIAQVVLPILLENNVAFKVAASLPLLRVLYTGSRVSGGDEISISGVNTVLERNTWSYALSQRGKFIAVYPNDDDQANRVANQINEAFFAIGLVGPKYFVPCIGDIQIGSTGGIFTRWSKTYGGESAGREQEIERIFPFIDMKRSETTKHYMCENGSSEITRRHPFDLDLYFLEQKLEKEIKKWGFHNLETFREMDLLK